MVTGLTSDEVWDSTFGSQYSTSGPCLFSGGLWGDQIGHTRDVWEGVLHHALVDALHDVILLAQFTW